MNYNGITDRSLGSTRAFASTGAIVRTASFKYDAVVGSGDATDEVHTHHFFAAVAAGDVVQTFVQGGEIVGTATATLKFRPAGSTTAQEVTVANVIRTAATLQTAVSCPNWEATSDGVLFLELSRYQRTSTQAGVSGTAFISRPA